MTVAEVMKAVAVMEEEAVAVMEMITMTDATSPSKNSRWLPGITLVIPCLNERETLSRVIAEAFAGLARSGLDGEVIVADNGSIDGSREIALRSGARVVDVPIRGYGAALHYGILAAKYSVVAYADADLSYPLLQIPALVQPLLDGESDFVLGTRMKGKIANKAMPLLNRYLGTPVLSFLIYRLFGLKTSDCNSGMRAFKRESYERLDLKALGMEYASEMLVKVSQTHLRFKEVPIDFRKDERKRAPHLRPWRDGMRHLKLLLQSAPIFR
jgi:glycosyltransferase involved in cell wall biosynthesis